MDVPMALVIAIIVSLFLVWGLVHVASYINLQMDMATAMSRVITIADIMVARNNMPVVSPNLQPDAMYQIEYSTTTATISPRIIPRADKMVVGQNVYNVIWNEVWIQDNKGNWYGGLVLTPGIKR